MLTLVTEGSGSGSGLLHIKWPLLVVEAGLLAFIIERVACKVGAAATFSGRG